MNNIDALIAELCPDGVEFRELQEVFDIKNGYTPSKAKVEYWTNGTIPWFRMDDIRTNGRILFNSIQHISPEAVKGNKLFPANSIIVSTSATIGEHALLTVDSLANQRFTYLTRKEKYLSKLDIKYFFYHMFILDEWCKININISGFAGVDMTKFKKFKIPIPPLPIQQEIVAILDKFTQLQAELQAELEARRAQYEYYRNELLNFEDKEAVWSTLGEIGKVCMCKRVMKHETKTVGDIPFYKIGTFGKEADAYISRELYEDYRKRFSFPEKGEILISASGTIGRTVIYNGEPAFFQDSNIVWIKNDESKVTNKFLFYFYKTVEWKTDGGTIARLYNDNLAKTKIPIPPLAEQNRIVAILDKFDKLVNDISEGLPAEIAARRKQYEYYRGELLEFKCLNR